MTKKAYVYGGVAAGVLILAVAVANAELLQGSFGRLANRVNCNAVRNAYIQPGTTKYVSNVASQVASPIASGVSSQVVSQVPTMTSSGMVVSSVPSMVTSGAPSTVISYVPTKTASGTVVTAVPSTVPSYVASTVTSQVTVPPAYVQNCMPKQKKKK